MEYLSRGSARRADPEKLFPGAMGVFCVAAPYGPREDDTAAIDPATGVAYARYLRGRDYHTVMTERLAALLTEAAESFPFRSKICCDTSAVLERSLAYLAGLGWIGKNTCLIHPQYGSYLFLAEAFLDEPPGGRPNPMPDRCGTCSACLDDCPTRAFTEPGRLDAKRCLSYWTLEKRGDLSLGADDRSAIANRVAGCDICQEVCPYNRKPRPVLLPDWSDEAADATRLRAWDALLAESEEEYRMRVRHSALSWVKYREWRRNLELVCAACGRPRS
jgi:epoxyqueuosine reductase